MSYESEIQIEMKIASDIAYQKELQNIKNGIWNKEIFSELKTLYSKMAKNSHGNDMSNYALGMGDYKIIYSIADSGISGEDRFLPYCSFFSLKGTNAVVAAYNWKKLF